MPQLEVYCTVDNCHYWGPENHCHASKILVTSNRLAEQQPDSIDALQGSMLQATPVDTCLETACKTFVPRHARSAVSRADGIVRQ